MLLWSVDLNITTFIVGIIFELAVMMGARPGKAILNVHVFDKPITRPKNKSQNNWKNLAQL